MKKELSILLLFWFSLSSISCDANHKEPDRSGQIEYSLSFEQGLTEDQEITVKGYAHRNLPGKSLEGIPSVTIERSFRGNRVTFYVYKIDPNLNQLEIKKLKQKTEEDLSLLGVGVEFVLEIKSLQG